MNLIGSPKTHVADFIERVGRRESHVIMQALTEAIKIAERSGKPGSDKKRIVKNIVKELVDIPNVPDWIEDLAIDYLIDVLAFALFPAPSGAGRPLAGD
jgi:hypothetical protein